ncbi:hypothetical protein BDV12DRAFT_203828 [Aspergillus spectabilis]
MVDFQALKDRLETRLFINGQYVDAESEARFTCYSPLDNSIVRDDIHTATEKDVDKAVHAAKQAFAVWSKTAPDVRGRVLTKFAELLEAHAAPLAEIEALCGGKSVKRVCVSDIAMAANTWRYYAGWCTKLEGDLLPEDGGFLRMVRREPIGVCAAITAFNGPLIMVAFKAGPCLAAGNTMIIKASEKTPLSSLYLGNLANEAGFPPGVINFVSGAADTGALLASHMGIQHISFTGSTAVGKLIAKAAAESNLKKVMLELGGKSPSIIFPDANLDIAVQWCTLGITINSGQACIASSRVYVHEEIREKFLDKFTAAMQKVESQLGDPWDAGTTVSSLVDKAQLDRVKAFVQLGKQEASLVTGGEQLFDKGCWMRPTIFVDPSPDAKILKDEIFGPVVVVSTFTDEKEVLERANDTEFGLAGAVFTQDVNRAIRISSKIASGTVGINCCTMVDIHVPFGGYKQSGWGRELGKYGIEEYTQLKTIFLNMTY